MIQLHTFTTKQEWRDARKGTIGGSDAAVAIGMNPYRTNVELWEEMTGRVEAQDISDNPAVAYGSEAEPLIRELFALDHDEIKVDYDFDHFWTNDKYPFAHASLDGRLSMNAPYLPESGVLEIKTATIQNALMMRDWKDQIPMHYYIQLLYYMEIVEADFGVLVAQLKFAGGKRYGNKEIREYYVRREDVQDDIKIIMDGVKRFYKHVERGTKPPLKLPEF